MLHAPPRHASPCSLFVRLNEDAIKDADFAAYLGSSDGSEGSDDEQDADAIRER